jgi:hypothetical protein
LGPGLLAVSGYSHVLDALSHPEQRGRLLSLLKVRILILGKLHFATSALRGAIIPSDLSSVLMMLTLAITALTRLLYTLAFYNGGTQRVTVADPRLWSGWPGYLG